MCTLNAGTASGCIDQSITFYTMHRLLRPRFCVSDSSLEALRQSDCFTVNIRLILQPDVITVVPKHICIDFCKTILRNFCLISSNSFFCVFSDGEPAAQGERESRRLLLVLLAYAGAGGLTCFCSTQHLGGRGVWVFQQFPSDHLATVDKTWSPPS